MPSLIRLTDCEQIAKLGLEQIGPPFASIVELYKRPSEGELPQFARNILIIGLSPYVRERVTHFMTDCRSFTSEDSICAYAFVFYGPRQKQETGDVR